LQLADVKFKLEKYEMQFDGLTREQIVQQNRELKDKVA
jgi:hypothetical protein